MIDNLITRTFVAFLTLGLLGACGAKPMPTAFPAPVLPAAETSAQGFGFGVDEKAYKPIAFETFKAIATGDQHGKIADGAKFAVSGKMYVWAPDPGNENFFNWSAAIFNPATPSNSSDSIQLPTKTFLLKVLGQHWEESIGVNEVVTVFLTFHQAPQSYGLNYRSVDGIKRANGKVVGY